MPKAMKKRRASDVEIKEEKSRKKVSKKQESADISSSLSTSISSSPSKAIPLDIINSILQYADRGTLNTCLRVSKDVYEIAGPMLYRVLQVNEKQPMRKILVGVRNPAWRVRNNRSAIRPPVFDRKRHLLSFVQRLIVDSHLCNRRTFAASFLPNLKTLLVTRFSKFCVTDYICDREPCPILESARPEKVVIHNSRPKRCYPSYTSRWPMLWKEFEVQSPVLTLILDERAHNGLPPQAQFPDVDMDQVKEIRMVINSDSPSQIDETAPRECCHGLVTVQQLARKIVAPILDELEVPTTVYVFHNFPNGPEDMKRLQHYLAKDLDEKHERRGSEKARQYPIYTMKTLRDYISEGVEDEFLPEDLEYWRKEDQKRVGLAEKLKS